MPQGSITDYAESLAIKLALGQATLASVLTTYVGFVTTVPSDAGGYTGELNGTYLSGAGRIALDFSPAAGKRMANASSTVLNTVITDAPAAVVGTAGYDSATWGAGNMIWFIPCEPHILKAGDTQKIDAGSIVIKAAGTWTIAGGNWMLDLLGGNTTQASAMTPYMGLWNQLPTDDIGTNGVEVTATNYARKPLAGLFSTPTVGQAVNTTLVNFTSTAWTTDAGDITGVGIWTALAGTLYLYASTPSKRYVAGDPVVYPVGAMVFQGD